MRTGARTAVALLAALAAGPAAAASQGASAQRLPYTVRILVSWGTGAGPDAFRADLEHALRIAFEETCFARVAPAGAADLRLAVVLSNTIDETSFDDSIATALAPGEPGEELRRVARFGVDVAATLSVEATGAEIAKKAMHAEEARRPVILGEDPQARARDEVVGTIVHDVTRPFCASKKAKRRINDALSAGPPAVPAR
jgi:hypothetical protein